MRMEEREVGQGGEGEIKESERERDARGCIQIGMYIIILCTCGVGYVDERASARRGRNKGK